MLFNKTPSYLFSKKLAPLPSLRYMCMIMLISGFSLYSYAQPTPLISEFEPNPDGTDPANVSVELSGTPGEAFSGWIVSIESDPGSSQGLVDRATQVSGTFDANGLLVVQIPDLENPSFTLILTNEFTGAVGTTDIDLNNDGIVDTLLNFGNILDAIGVPDAVGDEASIYGADLGGTDFAFTGAEPELIFRDASVGDLYAVNVVSATGGEAVFDVSGSDVTAAAFDTDPSTGSTFGTINPTVGTSTGTTLAIAPTDAVKAEGDIGNTNFTFTVTRSGDISGSTSVDFSVSGTADASDFGGVLPSGTVDFLANESTQPIEISVSGDMDVEPDEGFTVTLSNPTNGSTLTTATADGTIQNDDIAVLVSALISEFEPNPDGTDPANVSVELSGTPGEAFSGWIVSIESDPGSSQGLVDRATQVSGTFDANGLLVVQIPDLENPSFTVALTSEFTGAVGTTDVDTDDDGTAESLTAFGTIFDAIGVPDFAGDEATIYGADMGGTDFSFTGAEPELIFRDASLGDLYAVNIVSASGGEAVFDVSATDVTAAVFNSDPTTGATFGTINPTLAPVNVPTLISEFEPNPDGTDPANVSVELSGTPGEAFSGWIVSIESDPGSSQGLVDRATQVSGTFDTNGLLVVQIPDLENPSFTLILTDEFTGAVGTTDIDLNNDGIVDTLLNFGNILDAIGVPDAVGDEASIYGADLGGTDFAFTGAEPELIFRDASVGDLYAVNVVSATGGEAVFNVSGSDVTAAAFDTDPSTAPTFGTINPTFIGGDNLPPVIVTLTPANGATDVDVATNLIAEFNEDIQAGTGTIQLFFLVGDILVESFDIASSSQVTLLGNTLTIDPSIDLDPAQTYYVTLDPGAVEDLSGNAFAGFIDNSFWNFTTDDGIINFVGQCPSFVESFESAPGSSYTLSNPFDDGGFDFFNRYAVPDNGNGARDDFQSGWAGGFGILSQDNDGEGGAATRTITIGPIDISGAASPVGITGSFGALNGEPEFDNYEGSDGIRVFVDIDGTRTLIGAFVPDASGAGDLYQDTDLDGVGDGLNLTTTLSSFAFLAPSTGTALTIEIELTSNNSFEPLAVDNIRVDCEPPVAVAAKIHEVQGSGLTVTNPGGAVTVEGVVIGDYQGADELRGFFVQEESTDEDGDPNTSEGIFVFCGTCEVEVVEGQIAQVTGIQEEGSVSQINTTLFGGEVVVINASDNSNLVTPASVEMPAAASTEDEGTFESVEGMWVQFIDTLTVTEYFQMGRFGQIVLSEGGRLRQFTNDNMPSAAGFTAAQDETARRRIILDDLNNVENLTDPVFHPQPGGFAVDNFIRGGYTVSSLTGIMDFASPGSGDATWRIRPQLSNPVSFIADNPRTVAPESVDGTLKVASFNVLNYFTTIDEGSNICGPNGNEGCRGAHSAAELVRQRDKIVAALEIIDADVVGLIELENNAAAAPAGDGVDPVLEDLVNALNAKVGAGTYDFIDAGVIGTDVIKVAFIYKPGTVSPTGVAAILDASVDPRFDSDFNRPALAQTFTEISSGESFTPVVNHFKSKGSGCGAGDDDTTTGQGNCNGRRTAASEALADWLATDPTGSGSNNFLIIGDLNAYAQEDPIKALIEGADDTQGTSDDYTDLVQQFVGNEAYSFVFDGQFGYLDHALAHGDLLDKVTGTTIWNINSDEVNLLDYNDPIQDAAEEFFEAKPVINNLYDASPYRSSDHDPIIIGLQLAPEVVCDITNLALGKPTRTPCDYGFSNSGIGVDGITSGSTPWSANPDIVHVCQEVEDDWWEVNLGIDTLANPIPFKISEICVYNRSSSNEFIVNRLKEYYLFISCTPFDENATLDDLLNNPDIYTQFVEEPAAFPSCIQIPDVVGQYVRIQKQGTQPLHFAELEVYGCPFEAACGPQPDPCAQLMQPEIVSAGPFIPSDAPEQLMALPTGGTWTGPGVNSIGVFDPSIGAGTYAIAYKVMDGDCEKMATIEIEVLDPSACIPSNLAFGKGAEQSSTYGNGVASIAVDGDIDGTRGPWAFASIQHTQTESMPWWKVDLGENADIESINIFNRTDCCSNRLKDFYVFVSENPIDASQSISTLLSDSGISNYFHAGGVGTQKTIEWDIQGRYVAIKLTGNGPLHVAEVQVIGCPTGSTPECVFEEPNITGIAPSDCSINDGKIEVVEVVGTDYEYSLSLTEGWQVPNGLFTFFGLESGTYTVYIRDRAKPECVKEVQVDVIPEGGCSSLPCTTPENLAPQGIASQSSTYGNGEASFAIDENLIGVSPWTANLQHTQTEAQPWWMVGLEGSAAIDEVKIYNRSNGFQNRLKDFYVFVSANPIDGDKSIGELTADLSISSSYFEGAAGEMESFDFEGITGQYVLVKLTGTNPLHMAEVEVYGCLNGVSGSRFADANSGIGEEASIQLEAYPNPFSSSFTLRIEGELAQVGELLLVNALGQIIEDRQVSGNETLVLGNGLAKGMYFVQLREGEKIYQLKIVKTN